MKKTSPKMQIKQTKTGKYSLRLENREQRTNHQEFRMSDDFFRLVIESIEDYAVFTTSIDGKISSWNSGAERVLGYAEKEIIGQSADVFFIPEDIKKHAAEKELKKAVKEGRARDERWHMRKDGSRFWASGFVFPLKDASEQIVGFTKIMRDLTERRLLIEEQKKAEKKEVVNRERLQNLLMQAPAAIAIIEGPDHVYTLANPLYQQLIGKKELLGKPGREILPELTAQGIWDIFDKIYQTGEPYIGNEFPAQLDRLGNGRLDQGYFNFVGQPIKNTDGSVDSILIHAVEITDLVQSRQKVQESEAKLRRIIESNIIGIIFYDLNGEITYANDAFLEMVGYTRKEVEGKNIRWTEMSPKEWESRDKQAIRELRTTGVCTPFEKEFFRKDGTRVPVYIGAASFADGTEAGVAYVVDISEQRQLEKQKDDFIGIATHELKTPVTSIKAYAQALERRFRKNNDETSASQLQKMDGQINKLTNLIADLLDVTKIQGGQLQLHLTEFSFDELISEVMEELQRTTEKHQIVIEGKTKKTIYTDRDRIGQVLINLISNAIKYSPYADKIIVELKTDRKKVTVCVKDFGIGIPKDKQEKVFERFFRVSGPKGKTFPGLGLGLYISSEIVKRLGGRIWVESRQGKGSTFCVTLPIKTQVKEEIIPIREEELQSA